MDPMTGASAQTLTEDSLPTNHWAEAVEGGGFAVYLPIESEHWDAQEIACHPRCKAETGRGRMSATNRFAGTEDYTLPLRTHARQLPA